MNKRNLRALSSIGFCRDMNLGLAVGTLLEAVDQTGKTRRNTIETVILELQSLTVPVKAAPSGATRHRIVKPDTTKVDSPKADKVKGLKVKKTGASKEAESSDKKAA